MPKRPIITVDVDDRQFKNFLELFQKYQDEVQNLPGKWTQFDHAVSSTGEHFGQLAALLMTQTQLITHALHEHTKLGTSINTAKTGMHGLVAEAKSFTGFIMQATGSILKWAAFGGITAGLLGFGGLWGLDRLAGSASSARRSAAGLGVSPGEQKALETNYNRFFDPTNVLSNVAESKNDVSRRWAFATMGIDPNDVDGMSSGELATRLAPQAKKMFNEGGKTQQYAQASGLLNFFSMDDLRRLSTTSDEELSAAQKRYQSDKNQLGVSDPIARKWQDFLDQLDRAGQQISKVFIEDLIPLEPGLEKLSKSLVELVDAFMTNKDVKEWIKEAGVGLENIAKWVGSADFKKDVEAFVGEIKEGVGYLREFFDDMKMVAAWLKQHFGLGPDDTQYGPPDPNNQNADANRTDRYGVGGGMTQHGNAPEYGDPSPWSKAGSAIKGAWDWMTDTGFKDRQSAVIQGLMGQGHFSKEQALGISGMLQGEDSDFNPNAVGPDGKDFGIAQWRGERLDRFKDQFHYDMRDPTVDKGKKLQDEIKYLVWELTQGPEKDRGDAIKLMTRGEVVAGYGVEHFERPAPENVRPEQARAANYTRMARDTVTININNNTGGSAVVQTNQASVPQ